MKKLNYLKKIFFALLIFSQVLTAQQPVFNVSDNTCKTVKGAFFNPAGNKIAILDGTSVVTIWDAYAGKTVATLTGHKGEVQQLSFSPDGEKILTLSADNTAIVWNSAKATMTVRVANSQKLIQSAVFSPDGKKILLVYDSTATVWLSDSLKRVADLKGHRGVVKLAVFSRDSKSVFTSAADTTAKVWDSNTGTVLATFKGANNSIIPPRLTDDGKMLIEVPADSLIRITDIASKRIVQTVKGNFLHLADARISKDGTRLITFTERIALPDFFTMSDSPASISFNSTKRISLLVTSLVTGKGIFYYNYKAPYKNLEYRDAFFFNEEDTKVLLRTNDYVPEIWDIDSAKKLAALYWAPFQFTAKISGDGRNIVAIADAKYTTIWDFKTGLLKYYFYLFSNRDFLVVDAEGRFDGSANARKLCYITCDTVVIKQDSWKEYLWTPGLAERIMKGDTITGKSIRDIKLCDPISKKPPSR